MNEFVDFFRKHNISYTLENEELYTKEALMSRVSKNSTITFNSFLKLPDGRCVIIYRAFNISKTEVKECKLYFNIDKLPEQNTRLPSKIILGENLQLLDDPFIVAKLVVMKCPLDVETFAKQTYGLSDLGTRSATYKWLPKETKKNNSNPLPQF